MSIEQQLKDHGLSTKGTESEQKERLKDHEEEQFQEFMNALEELDQ